MLIILRYINELPTQQMRPYQTTKRRGGVMLSVEVKICLCRYLQ